MPKIDYRRIILPDIEMYGGNTDLWEIPLYHSDDQRMTYESATHCTFTLVIKDYGYTHRTNGATYFTLTKPGTIIRDDDELALLTFQFEKAETFAKFGKFTYQVIAESSEFGFRNVAQGNLFITKAIDQ